MPQFDATWFASQIFWLVVTFGALYWVMAKIALPRIGQVLEERAERIAGDLDRAKLVRDEAADVLAQYEKVLAGARAEAQTHMRAAQEEIAKQSVAAQAKLAAELTLQSQAAEARIAAAKREAVANVREIAVEVAAAAAGRLSEGGVDGARITAAVDAALAERR